ncbi:hypothetical protein HK405_015581 [Cladochytrium tenue]|nr:hypothetical protein HK405_015581 [Cladochytrium tenue]
MTARAGLQRAGASMSLFVVAGLLATAALAVAAPGAAYPGWSTKGSSYTAVGADYCRHVWTHCLVVGANSTFTSIQAAIDSLDETSPATIVVLSGTYNEQLNVTRQGPLYLRGQTDDTTDDARNTVNVTWAAFAGSNSNLTDNVFSSVLTVAPNLNASRTGSGPTGWAVLPDNPFGNVDFRAYNLNFLNLAAERSVGPALTLATGYSNSSFYQCGFYSYQDTIYVGKISNAYFHNCTVAGQTDFLYGFGTAWFERSTLVLRSCGGGVTAWKGTNTTFTNAYGVYVNDSQVIKANSSLAITHKCSLGRPWNSLHRSVFASTYLDDSILPAGYTIWSSSTPNFSANLTLMAEYSDDGPGYNETARVAGGVDTLLDDAGFAPYSSPARVFKFPFSDVEGNTAWIDDCAWSK